MYIFPDHVDYYEEDGVIFVTSKLRQKTVKLSDPAIMEEFAAVVRCGGCPEISTPLGKLLHEQELLVDEREIEDSIKELRGVMNDSLILAIMPTEGCNFRCSYCYEDHAPISMRRKTLDQIQRYIEEQAPKFKHIGIAWFGGEPTLCKDVILETSKLLLALQKTNSFSFTSGMTTNGYLLGPEEFQQYYSSGITSYQITLDGRNHDQTRPHVSGKGTLQRILDNLTAIASLPQEKFRYHVTIRHNVLPGDEDFGWYDYLNDLFGKDSRFSMLVCPAGGWSANAVQAPESLIREKQDQLMRKHVEYLNKIGMRCHNEKRGPLSQICYASYPHSMVFRASGKIEKCAICMDHPKNYLGVVDPEKGILINREVNQLWCSSALKPECYHCSDILSCLNMQCKMPAIVDGDHFPPCPCSV